MTTEMDLTKETNKANKEIAASTNQANKDIAQMNNEFNLNMLDKQIEYNKQAYAQQRADSVRFWQMQNEYNTPSNQMKRLEDAGINPYMGMGAVSSGTASSVQPTQMQGITTPTATPYQAVGYTAQKPDLGKRLQIIQSVLGGINDIIGNVYEGRTNQQQVRGMRLKNDFDAYTYGARVGGILAGTENTQLRNEYQKAVNAVTPALLSNQATAGYLSNFGQALTNSMMSIDLDFMPVIKRFELAGYVADVNNKIMDGDIKGKQIEEYKERIKGLIQDNRGKKFTNDQNERLQKYLDDAIKNEAIPDWKRNPVGAARGVITTLDELGALGIDTVPGTNGKVYGRNYGRLDTLKHLPWYLEY